MSTSRSALPTIYYAIFAVYEPLLSVGGLIATFSDPQKIHRLQAPWPSGSSPFDKLSPATMVTILQLAHTCTLLGIINVFILNGARKYIVQPEIQEKIVASLLTPLLLGDIFHLVVTIYALGEYRWSVSAWPPTLVLTIFFGVSLLIPRICWHLGLGRYVASRDEAKKKQL